MSTQAKTGTVVFKEGTYFLEAEGKHVPIPVSPHTQPTQLKELVGQKVEILYSEPQTFVAGLAKGNFRILCYYPPATALFGVVGEESRATLARQFLNEGVLSKETFEKLGGNS